MTNKEASNKQEKMVANYMDWRVVSGSGARPFRPGDIGSEYFLVECKTHTKPQVNIVFYQKHWNKIAIEARSVNRYPMLVVDNGTQKSEYTWIVVPKGIITNDHVHRMINLTNTSNSGNTITFKHEDAKSLYKEQYIDEAINYFEDRFGEDERVAIMPLSEFKKFYEEQFEC